MVNVVNELPATTKNGSFVNMVEIANMSQMLNVLWKCALTTTAMVQSSAQIEPF